MARPEKPINWEIVLLKMEAGCTAKMIAHECNISLDRFYDRFIKEYDCSFGDYSPKSYESGNGKILYTQYIKALGGNVPLLLRLGELRLNQKSALNQDAAINKEMLDEILEGLKRLPGFEDKIIFKIDEIYNSNDENEINVTKSETDN
jgi:hypothetical protein